MPPSVAVIQARVGSTRLPGKVMYPLDGRHVLDHVIERASSADLVEETIVATSTEKPDDVIERYASEFGADVIRGSESDVLGRFERTVQKHDPDIILRITGDCPLISPAFIDTAVERIRTENVDYVSAGLERTFPRGVTCEAFTVESFERMSTKANEPHHREHVTPYYREHPAEFDLYNLESTEIYREKHLQNRTDLRLTLDEPADYQLFERLYREIDHQGLLALRDVIKYIDERGLETLNQDVEQKSV